MLFKRHAMLVAEIIIKKCNIAIALFICRLKSRATLLASL